MTLKPDHVGAVLDLKGARNEFVHWVPPLTPKLRATTRSNSTESMLLCTPTSHRPNTPQCSPGRAEKGAVSSTLAGLCSVYEIKSLLDTFQAGLFMQLEQWTIEHQQNLDRTLQIFRESLDAQHAGEPCSPKTIQRSFTQKSNKSSLTSNFSQDYATVTLRRSVTTQSGMSKASNQSNGMSKVSEEYADLSSFERRPSINSTGSDLTKYLSVQEMRDQHLVRGMSGTSPDSSRKSSKDNSFKYNGGCDNGMKVRSIVNNFYFELLFALLIFVNSIMLGVEVHTVLSSPTDSVPHFFYHATLFFTIAFLIELVLRMIAAGGFISFLFYSELRAWNWFDFLVVMCSLVEVVFNFVLLGGGSQSVTRIMRMARMTRLGRVLRVARIVRFVSQLRVLVVSILSTLQTLLWACFLLLIIIYVFAVLLAQATAGHLSDNPNFEQGSFADRDEELMHYWGSLSAAMYTLFMSISGGVSWEVVVFAISEVHWMWGACFTAFIAFSSFALINVMTATFCQSAIESAQRNVDIKWQNMCADKRKHMATLKRLFKSLDGNKKGTLSLKKLQHCWGDEAMQAFLTSMELEPHDCWTFFAILDQRDQEVNAHDFVEGCLRLKGYAKAFDMAVMTYELRHLSKQNVLFMNRMQDCMQEVAQALGRPAASNFHVDSYSSEDGGCSP